MKTLWIFISFLLLTIFLSCSNSVELKRKNKELNKLNSQLQDSLEKLITQPDFIGFPENLEIDTTKGLFGKIVIDTLVLFAEYADCGEWGGHREWLKIYNTEELTKAIFIYDSVACRHQNEGKKYFQTEKTIYTIDKDLQQEVLYYLFDLNRMTFLEQEMVTNAANLFSASINHRKDIPPLFNYDISFIFCYFKWNHFQKLKEKIKTTAKTVTHN